MFNVQKNVHLFCVISMFVSGRMLINALRILIFLCFYLGEGRGCTNALTCIGTHNQPLLQNLSMLNATSNDISVKYGLMDV